jgi:hypothetical protein
MQNRIDRLEGLVLSLMTNGAQSAGPAAAAAAISRSQSDSAGSLPLDLDHDDDEMIKEEDEGEDSDVDGVTNSLGVLKVDADKGKTLYLGDSHWHLVLADVRTFCSTQFLFRAFNLCSWGVSPGETSFGKPFRVA